VLALAAIKLGAREAEAIDCEPQALEATRRNAELNGFEAAVQIGAPDALGGGSFDLILANILAQPLIDLADQFAGLQPPGAHVVLSGILETQMDAVEAHYARWYEAIEGRRLDGWGLLIGRRRSGYDR
jgi:ribosomal protein L11 methyltransferase